MKRVAVLHSSPYVTWTSRRLLHALASEGFEAHYVLWDAFSITSNGGCRIRYRGKCRYFDAVIVRGMGRSLTPERLLFRYTLLEAMEDEGVLVVNPAQGLQLARNKLASLLRFKKCAIPVPQFMSTENPSTALRYVKEYGKAVIKPLMGSLGLGSFLVSDVDTAYYVVNLLAELNQPLLVQKFVPKRHNRDIRAFVVGDQVVAAIYRFSDGWKTNIAQGARAEPAELTERAARLALEATRCLGLLYAGVDIVEDDVGNLYVLEANASPLWRGLYKATGVDPAVYIASMLKKLLTEDNKS
jgi:ribosomal protein S6--L-glutamate ligase